MKLEKMSVAEWIGVLDNPRQRDTLRHAKGTKGGEVRLRDIGCRFINAGEGYLKGTRYRTAIKPIDAIKYLAGK